MQRSWKCGFVRTDNRIDGRQLAKVVVAIVKVVVVVRWR